MTDPIKELQRSLKWLAIATVVLYLALIGVGIYVYVFSEQAKQIDENTERLNQAIAAACEVGIAPDSEEPRVVHELATGELVITTKDCQLILRKVSEDEP